MQMEIGVAVGLGMEMRMKRLRFLGWRLWRKRKRCLWMM